MLCEHAHIVRRQRLHEEYYIRLLSIRYGRAYRIHLTLILFTVLDTTYGTAKLNIIIYHDA